LKRNQVRRLGQGAQARQSLTGKTADALQLGAENIGQPADHVSSPSGGHQVIDLPGYLGEDYLSAVERDFHVVRQHRPFRLVSIPRVLEYSALLITTSPSSATVR